MRYSAGRVSGGKIFAAVIALLLLTAASSKAPVLAENFTLRTPQGENVTLLDAAGARPQILLFWATWCPFCKALMPHLQSIRMEYGENIGVLAVTVDHDGDPATFLQQNGFDFTLLPDDGTVAASYGLTGTPGLYLVDTEGAIRFDLGALKGPDLGPRGGEMSRSERAARLAPYWAAELRKAIDAL